MLPPSKCCQAFGDDPRLLLVSRIWESKRDIHCEFILMDSPRDGSNCIFPERLIRFSPFTFNDLPISAEMLCMCISSVWVSRSVPLFRQDDELFP